MNSQAVRNPSNRLPFFKTFPWCGQRTWPLLFLLSQVSRRSTNCPPRPGVGRTWAWVRPAVKRYPFMAMLFICAKLKHSHSWGKWQNYRGRPCFGLRRQAWRDVQRQAVPLAVALGFQQDLFLINHALLLRGMEREHRAFPSPAFRKPPPKTLQNFVPRGTKFCSAGSGTRCVLGSAEIPQDTSHLFLFISSSMTNPRAAFAEGVRR
jgi:hypothetical protein